MLRRRHCTHLVSAVLLCLVSTSGAQTETTPALRRVAQPLRPAHLDIDTGTVTRGGAVERKGLGGFATSTTLDNNDFSGFVGVDSGPVGLAGPCEWMFRADKGAGRTGGKSGLMTSFQFAYCSSALDALSGGPGGKTRIGFRTGYGGPKLSTGGPSGTDVGTFNLSGLPANTASSSFLGGSSCYLIDIDFGTTPLVLRDGPIGWSWQFRDLGTDGVLAATFPFLSCIQSCSGPGPDGTGNMVDQADRYCGLGRLSQSFSFGTGAPGSAYYTSASMALREAEPIATANVPFNGSGTNPVILAPGFGPGLYHAYTVTLDCTGADATKLALWRYSFGPVPPPISSPFGEILVSLSGTGRTLFAPHAGGIATLGGSYFLPSDLSFYGVCWNVQGFCGDTPRGFLSNALTQTYGF